MASSSTPHTTLRDRFGRVARDLRVSLTDRCNLRCSYCMPAEGLEWLPTDQTLSDDEVIQLCTIAVEMCGIERLRFTGGEPLLRRGLETILAACAALRTHQGKPVELALTTNALGLDKRAHSLAAAGLHRVNISLDTLDPSHYAHLTRRDRLDDALAGIRAAVTAGLRPVKINAVIMPGINDADAAPLLDFCLENALELRFIEQMPLGPTGTWQRNTLVTRDTILELLGASHKLTPVDDDDPHAPARLWYVDGDPHQRVGIIASVTAPFCESCDRTRLTSDGQIRSCLFSTTETDLRSPLRSGASNEEIAALWAQAMWHKPRMHGLDDADFAQASRTMSRIGG